MTEFSLGGFTRVESISAMELLAQLDEVAAFVLQTGCVFAVCSHDGDFVQMLADSDGDLHIETSRGELAVQANLGFDDFVPEFDFIGRGFLPAAWPGRHKIAAEVLMRTLLDIHKVQFPLAMTVFTDRTSEAADEGS